MDGESNGSKPYEQMDDLGGNTPIFGNAYIYIYLYICFGYRPTYKNKTLGKKQQIWTLR